MPTRRERIAPVPEYQPYNLTAKTTTSDGLAVGALLNTTTTSSVGGAGSATITLAAITSDVQIGTQLAIWNSSVADEIVVVTAFSYTNKTVTATFANAHSGTTNVTTTKGVKLGTVVVNNAGSAVTLVLWNGVPGLNGATPPATKIGSIACAYGTLEYFCAVDQGLWITYTGTTAGDITINTLTDPI